MRSNWFCKYKMAHRGLHNDKYPENSLGAFENACKHGFAIELDIRILKDGTPVIFHDENLNRMCGVDKSITDLTIDELPNYPLLNSKYNIPTLQEVLDLVDAKTPLMIELKPVSKKDKIEERTYDLLKDYSGEYAIKSFNPLTMFWFKKHAPQVLRGMLSCYFEDFKLPLFYKVAVKKLWLFNWVKPDFISYNFDNLPNKFVSKRKVPVLAWTIDSKDKEQEAMKVADNVIFENYIPESPINYE